MEKTNKIKYILYARKSSEDKSKQIQSIESQIGVMKDFAKKNDLEVVEIMHEEKSGKTPGVRVVFAKMIKLLEKGEANGILVWKLDRIARNLLEGGCVIDMLQNGVIQEIRTPEEKHLPTDNVYSIAIQLCGANQYSRDLSTNVKRGVKDKLNKGWRPGSAPQGYLNSKIKDRGENDLSSDLERFHLVRKMWDLMLTGNYTPPKILDIATNEWGYTTRKTKKGGGKPLARSSIYRMFTNIFYAGIIEHKGVQYPGKHEKMVTLEEFDRVQILLGRKGKPRPKTHTFAFTGCIHCGECDCLYTAIEKTKLIKSANEIKEFTYYFCTRKKKSIQCSQKGSLTKENLEIQIEKEIRKYKILPQFLNWALEILNENKEIDIEGTARIKEMQQKAIAQAENELKELTVMRRRILIDDDTFLQGKSELEKKITQLKGSLKGDEAKDEELLELNEKVFTYATYAHNTFLTGGLELQKEMLMGIGEYPIIKHKNLIIEPYEWFIPIKNNYPPLEEAFLRLEPHKIGQNEAQKEALASIRLTWRGRWDLNPRSPP